MQTNFAEQLALTHASMKQAAEIYPGRYIHHGNGVKAKLHMRANEFRPFIRSQRNYPDAFALVVRSMDPLIESTKRSGRYIRSIIESIAKQQMLHRYEVDHVVRTLASQEYASVEEMVESCPNKISCVHADIKRVMDTLWDLGLLLYERSGRMGFDYSNPAAVALRDLVAKEQGREA